MTAVFLERLEIHREHFRIFVAQHVLVYNVISPDIRDGTDKIRQILLTRIFMHLRTVFNLDLEIMCLLFIYLFKIGSFEILYLASLCISHVS